MINTVISLFISIIHQQKHQVHSQVSLKHQELYFSYHFQLHSYNFYPSLTCDKCRPATFCGEAVYKGVYKGDLCKGSFVSSPARLKKCFPDYRDHAMVTFVATFV